MGKNPKAYTSPEDVQTAGAYHKAGDVFVTDAEPNGNWTEVKPKDAHAIQASTEKVSPDVPLENQSIDALRALALTKNVDGSGMSKKDLIAAIKAANEPAL
ncbi:hypothetical protein [Sphingomonas melonis]|uniref:hypothetical protein n=1 Tax=Sphingomonas melonis TaxID=152682 RepID=UPI0036A59E2C